MSSVVVPLLRSSLTQNSPSSLRKDIVRRCSDRGAFILAATASISFSVSTSLGVDAFGTGFDLTGLGATFFAGLGRATFFGGACAFFFPFAILDKRG